jgi:hypothetical protein
MTASAAAFMRSSASRSFGLTNLYLAVSLLHCQIWELGSGRAPGTHSCDCRARDEYLRLGDGKFGKRASGEVMDEVKMGNRVDVL